MAREFKSYKALFDYINKNIRTSLREVALEVEEIWKDYIIKAWYQENNPTDYFRSYNYLNSLTVGKVVPYKGGYSVEIYFDTDKIIPNYIEDSGWNQHMSVDGSETYNGKYIPELIPHWIEYGQSSRIYSYDGIYSKVHTRIELEHTKKHIKKLMEIFKSRGFNVVIK